MLENEKTFECLELEISFHLHAIIICIMAVLNVLVLQGVSSEICNPMEKCSVTERKLFFTFTFVDKRILAFFKNAPFTFKQNTYPLVVFIILSKVCTCFHKVKTLRSKRLKCLC